ncbi:MAG: (2Fe-2S)-binding protein [Rhodospirillaceae bacterium]|nr:(2Fe-2S)-binding protein [Rhodospirillaceae bacterium]
MLELCRLDELEDGEARGFNVEGGEIAQRLIVIRRGEDVKAYVNLCPHIGSRLDGHQLGHFLDEDDPDLLFCDSHAAWFRIEDGECVEGPCTGQKLFPAAVAVDGNRVVYTRDGVELVDEISKIVSTTD